MRKNLGCNFGLDLYMVGKMVVFTKDTSSFLGAIKLARIRVVWFWVDCFQGIGIIF